MSMNILNISKEIKKINTTLDIIQSQHIDINKYYVKNPKQNYKQVD